MHPCIRIQKRLQSVKSIGCIKNDTSPKQDACYIKGTFLEDLLAALNPGFNPRNFL